jgi:hypothetical protein
MIKVQHMNTNDQLADILTKSLGGQKFIEMRKKVGVEDVKQGNNVTEVNVDGNLAVVRIGVGLGSSTNPSRTRFSIPWPSPCVDVCKSPYRAAPCNTTKNNKEIKRGKNRHDTCLWQYQYLFPICPLFVFLLPSSSYAKFRRKDSARCCLRS